MPFLRSRLQLSVPSKDKVPLRFPPFHTDGLVVLSLPQTKPPVFFLFFYSVVSPKFFPGHHFGPVPRALPYSNVTLRTSPSFFPLPFFFSFFTRSLLIFGLTLLWTPCFLPQNPLDLFPLSPGHSLWFNPLSEPLDHPPFLEALLCQFPSTCHTPSFSPLQW